MVSSSPLISGWKFKPVRMRKISSSGTVIPKTPLTFLMLVLKVTGSKEFPVLTFLWVLETLPTPSSSTRCRARFMAISVAYSSTPLEYLWLASEDWPRARELLRMLSRANFADSNITSVVVSRISEFKPPIIPANATGFFPSQITRLFGFKVNSFSSKVTIFSPSFARLTWIALPSRKLQSNAWSGWPSSRMM